MNMDQLASRLIASCEAFRLGNVNNNKRKRYYWSQGGQALGRCSSSRYPIPAPPSGVREGRRKNKQELNKPVT